MTRFSGILPLAFFLAVGFVSGCNDDDDGTAGVNSNKKISDLSEQEMYNLCIHYSKDIVSVVKDACVIAGIGASILGKDACEAAIKTCEDLTEVEMNQEDMCDMSDDDYYDDDYYDDDEDMENCDITVGQYDACITNLSAASAALFANLSCESTISDLPDLPTSMDTPESCRAIENECPFLLPSDNDVSMSGGF